MIIAECPACHDPVRIPHGISERASLCCPLCKSSINAGELFDQLPPLLEVVEDPGSNASPAVVGAGASPDTSIDSPELTLATESDSPPAFLFEEQSAAQREAPSFYADTRSTPAERARRARGKNPLITFGGIVAGGLLAFPLAQLVLWWLVGQDNFELGPSVAKFAPFVVPEKFRGDTTFTESKKEREAERVDRNSWRNPDISSQSMERKGRDRTFGSGDEVSSGLGEEVSNRIKDSTDPNRRQSDSDSNGSSPTKDSDASPSTNSASDDGFQMEPGFSFSNPTPLLRKQYQSSDQTVYGALNKTLNAYDSWDASESEPGTERLETANELYSSMQELGHSLVFIDPANERSLRATNEVLSALSDKIKDAGLQQFLSNKAASQIRTSQNSLASGIVFTGRIKTMKLDSGFLVTRIALDDASNTEVDVHGWHAPLDAFRPGAQVAIFGARVRDAKASLGSFDSSSSAIVGGYVLILQRAKAS